MTNDEEEKQSLGKLGWGIEREFLEFLRKSLLPCYCGSRAGMLSGKERWQINPLPKR
jgi:hypothetical protein